MVVSPVSSRESSIATGIGAVAQIEIPYGRCRRKAPRGELLMEWPEGTGAAAVLIAEVCVVGPEAPEYG